MWKEKVLASFKIPFYNLTAMIKENRETLSQESVSG
jgi:hypothetical protein